MSTLRSQIRSASRFMEQASNYGTNANTQRRRLEVVNLIPQQNGTELCPICHQSVAEISEPISAIREAFNYVQSELEHVERERPQLDGYINERKNQILILQDQVSSLNRQISALTQESATVRERLALDQRRHRVVGSINFYLNLSDNVRQDETDENIDDLRTQIESLEEEVGRDEKLERLRSIQTRLSSTATQIAVDLPFEERYKDDPVDLNLRDLSVGVITPTGRVLMRGVGSDQNYLTFHVAVHLALHRHFASLNRPVPGVLVFDQLSRPFYPQDESDENEKVIKSTDAIDLKKYFDVLFNEVAKGYGLQVIILEHAYFDDDDRFITATKERWIPGNIYLIPTDWPDRSKTG